MPNIALNKPADANSSVAPYLPGKAVDGVVTPLARWMGSSPIVPLLATEPNWLRIDTGAIYWVNRWVVRQMGALGWSSNYNLSDYKLQGSLDNLNWFDIDTVTNNSANQSDRNFTPRKIRWVRIFVTRGLRCNNNFASITDFELYDAANPPYLTGLTIQDGSSNVPISPVFSSAIYSYNATVGSTTSTVALTAIAANTATIKVNNTPVTSGTPFSVNLNPGTNQITVQVTSQDGTMAETYTVVVTKPVKSAYLSAMTVNGIRGALSPNFSSTTMSYTASVAAGVTSVTVTPTAEDSQAVININTFSVLSGQTSPIVSLIVGTNTITVLVTAADNSSHQTYTITVTRPS